MSYFGVAAIITLFLLPWERVMMRPVGKKAAPPQRKSVWSQPSPALSHAMKTESFGLTSPVQQRNVPAHPERIIPKRRFT